MTRLVARSIAFVIFSCIHLAGYTADGVTTTVPGFVTTNIPGTCNQWSPPFLNTNVFGGTANSATTLQGCQSACASTATCSGIDWNPGNPIAFCFLILANATGIRNNGTIQNITHYDFLGSNCNVSTPATSASTTSSATTTTFVQTTTSIPSSTTASTTGITAPCNQWSAPFMNTNVFGGTANGATTLQNCQSACASTATCSGIDWNPGNPVASCFLILANATGIRNNGTIPNITHYDFLGSNCNVSAPTTSASPTSSSSAVVSTTTSTGVQSTSSTSAGSTISSTAVTAPCNQWSPPFENTNVFGGTANGATTLQNCQSACASTATCSGIDWNPGNPIASCFLILANATGIRNNGTIANITHYDFLGSNCNVSVPTVSASPTSSSAASPTSSSAASSTSSGSTGSSTAVTAACDQWSPPFFNTNVFGGTANSAATLQSCQTACTSTATCSGIDWNPGNPIASCFLILANATGIRNNGTIANITHYDFLGSNCNVSVSTSALPTSNASSVATTTTATGVQTTSSASSVSTSSSSTAVTATCNQWSPPFENTNVFGGTANSATTLQNCQSACSSTATCSGIDWNPGNPVALCFLILANATGIRNNGTIQNITHYDFLGGNCNVSVSTSALPTNSSAATTTTVMQNTSSASSGSTVSSSAVTAPCNQWSPPFENTNVFGGTANGATTLQNCQSACASTATCSGIDWNPGNPVASCFLILANATGIRNNGTIPNITHYDFLGSNCNVSASTTSALPTSSSSAVVSTTTSTGVQSASSTSAGSTLSSTAVTAPCNQWSPPFENTNVFGGTANSATTLQNCQSACASTATCSGIDWNPGNPVASCFLILANATGIRNNGTIQNITHYDFLGSNCNVSASTSASPNSSSSAVASTTMSTGVQSTGSTSAGSTASSTAVTAPCNQWSPPFENTNVFGGTANSATTLQSCQSACASTATCSGIDWNPGNPIASCFLILANATGIRNNGTIQNITHYDFLGSNCNGSASTASALPTSSSSVAPPTTSSSAVASTTTSTGVQTASSTSAVTATCNQWSPAFENTNVFGGTANGATTLQNCQSACASTATCSGIDWNPGNPIASCFLILANATGTRNNGTIQNITHYDFLGSNCNVPSVSSTPGSTTVSISGSPATAVQTTTISTSSASTPVTGGTTTCSPTFVGSNDTNVFGGTHAPNANTLQDCFNACVANLACNSIDWNPANPDGVCYLIFPSQPTLNYYPGITHYVLTRRCS